MRRIHQPLPWTLSFAYFTLQTTSMGFSIIDQMTDQEIVQAILQYDADVTSGYLYGQCQPLFKSIYSKFYTDCENWIELVNEIYLYIMAPTKSTNTCKLAAFGFRCSLTMWLKIVTENYCHQLFAKRADIFEENVESSDRFGIMGQSLELDLHSINMEDLRRILELMPNQRYRALIEYRYVQDHTNEETAVFLNMSMANYYNKHKLAKAQFVAALRKENLV